MQNLPAAAPAPDRVYEPEVLPPRGRRRAPAKPPLSSRIAGRAFSGLFLGVMGVGLFAAVVAYCLGVGRLRAIFPPRGR